MTFIKPYHIDVLDAPGLTATDIAKSLEVRPPDVRRKLEHRNFLDRLKSQGLFATTFATANEVNSLPFTEFALTTAAAKFFVAKYDSEIGDQYLTFLLALESEVLELKQLEEKDPLLSQMMQSVAMRREQLVLKNKVTTLEEKTVELATRVDRMNGDTGYRTVLAHCRDLGIPLPLNLAKEIGRRASQLCRQRGLPRGKVADERFKSVNSYPVEVLNEVVEPLRRR